MAGLPDSYIASQRQFWREFLKLYQQMPELWDVNHSDYRSKELRNEAYEILQTKLQEIQPNATKSDVGRRINIFRTNYRREQMRIWKQNELGINSELCKPTLWFYDNMSFLLSQESFQRRSKRMRGRPRGVNAFDDSINDSKMDPLGTAALTAAFLPTTTTTKEHSQSSASVFNDSFLVSPKMEIFDNEMDEIHTGRTHAVKVDNTDIATASEFNEPSCSATCTTVLRGSASQKSTVPLSESSQTLAKSWAIQYEEMPPTQRILARKAIADILFEGCMGNLRINRIKERSSVANPL